MFKKRHANRYKALMASLIKMRKEAGLTQVDLAKKLDVPQQFVSKYETGERNLDFIEVTLICEACGKSINSLKY